MGYKSYNYKQ